MCGNGISLIVERTITKTSTPQEIFWRWHKPLLSVEQWSDLIGVSVLSSYKL
ncbi:hypothetical protein [Umezakia ovalisporum]|uniref:Uncharacterized protein n=2 Tax=Umezakia ovalisporum TaxID=75695 RepID=A0AA43GZH0_9CYAN|nr:hypothetical protein [Umezakia ovalisporum]MDH6056155.1 hypothetical protein [Umezakia ovalisporum FSS-43]MDH6064010.1 hypothetical protein [Umezakia ovalisporum FSS-62]MDH6066574.1 hypothetical protein [Umezakia ovalisporum APH033B]MDH6070688.1 hypothetical protein [Umezakia ovalisporum CobakiLakeA]MDH6073947.1 hypothetical protein [Umezakia ovalisporum CS-1034]